MSLEKYKQIELEYVKIKNVYDKLVLSKGNFYIFKKYIFFKKNFYK
jgi:hypothetical protein